MRALALASGTIAVFALVLCLLLLVQVRSLQGHARTDRADVRAVRTLALSTADVTLAQHKTILLLVTAEKRLYGVARRLAAASPSSRALYGP